METLGTPLILLGSARSGTTLFQRILNSYDEVIVWGEHAGALKDVAHSYFKLKNSSSMEEFSFPQAKGRTVDLSQYKSPEQWQAWNNWFAKEDLKVQYSRFLEGMFSWPESEIKYWGFKEIRYGADDHVSEFVLDLYPRAKIVVLFRNPLNVIDSQLSAFSGIGGRLEKLRKLILLPKIIKMAYQWRKDNLFYLGMSKAWPDNVVIVRYESLINDPEILAVVLSKVGLAMSDAQSAVLKMKEGRGSAYSKEGNTDLSTRWRKLGIIPSFFVYCITIGAVKQLRAGKHSVL